MSADGPVVGRAAIRPSVLGRVAVGRGVAGRAAVQRPAVTKPPQGRASVSAPPPQRSAAGRASVSSATLQKPPARNTASAGRASVATKPSAGRASVRQNSRSESYTSTSIDRSTLPRKRRKRLPWWQEFSLLVIAAFVVAILIRSLLLQVFLIPTGSMEQTLRVHDRVIVNKVEYLFQDPARGDIIVFRGEDSWAPEHSVDQGEGVFARTQHFIGSLVGMTPPGEKDFIKRVIGVPGDTVQCCDEQGRVLVNDKPLQEPYIYENNPQSTRHFKPIVVPEGRLFVMGDHRGKSKDSRAYIDDKVFGTISAEDVIGRAFFIAWPLSHAGGVGEATTFESSSSQAPTPHAAFLFGSLIVYLPRRFRALLPRAHSSRAPPSGVG